MKSVALFFLLATCAHAQYWPFFFPFVPYPPAPWYNPFYDPRPSYSAPYFPQPSNSEYAVSLGGAPVGLYKRRRNTGPFGTTSEVTGVSLGNAKVGLYGKDRASAGDPYQAGY